jgi:hypothetical protein
MERWWNGTAKGKHWNGAAKGKSMWLWGDGGMALPRGSTGMVLPRGSTGMLLPRGSASGYGAMVEWYCQGEVQVTMERWWNGTAKGKCKYSDRNLPQPHLVQNKSHIFWPRKDPVPIVQEAGWAPCPVWTRAKNLAPTGILSPDRPSRMQALYRLSYRGPKAKDNSNRFLNYVL